MRRGAIGGDHPRGTKTETPDHHREPETERLHAALSADPGGEL